MAREINSTEISNAVRDLFLEASFILPEDIVGALESGQKNEESEVGQGIFSQLLDNAELARRERIPICQDTGLATLFVELGQEVVLTGDPLNESLTKGVREAYEQGFLRKSICHPLSRKNTGDNTPAVIHLKMVEGDTLKISGLPKGGGAENMSRIFMLTPSAGWEGAKEKIIETVKEAGPNPCPPLIVGVVLGGSFDLAAREVKQTLLRPIGEKNPDPEAALLEAELLKSINDLGIGPQGLGGRITAMAVHLSILPCHIASMPLAVNLQCHASRHAVTIL